MSFYLPLDEVEDFQASYNAAQKHLTVAVMKKAGYADAVGSRVKNVKAALTEYFGNCPTVAVIEKKFPYIGSGKKAADHRGKMKNEW